MNNKKEDTLSFIVKEKFKNNIVNLNGNEYIPIEFFEAICKEACIYDSILGIITNKLGTLEVSNKELYDYLVDKRPKPTLEFIDEKYLIRRK